MGVKSQTLRQMFLNSSQGYIWFISCIFQALSIIIMESVMGRLLGNPEKRDFFEEQIHDFDRGNAFFIHVSSVATLFGKFNLNENFDFKEFLIVDLKYLQVCTMFAFLLANFNIPRPYSAKREFLNKINELRQKQKEKAEAERKENAVQGSSLWNSTVRFDFLKAVSKEKEKRQKEVNKKLKSIRKQESMIRKRSVSTRFEYDVVVD